MSRAANFAPATASICCAGHAQKEGTGHAEDLHSSCQAIDGNSHRSCVLFVDFPTGPRLDVSVQRYPARLMHPRHATV